MVFLTTLALAAAAGVMAAAAEAGGQAAAVEAGGQAAEAAATTTSTSLAATMLKTAAGEMATTGLRSPGRAEAALEEQAHLAAVEAVAMVQEGEATAAAAGATQILRAKWAPTTSSIAGMWTWQ